MFALARPSVAVVFCTEATIQAAILVNSWVGKDMMFPWPWIVIGAERVMFVVCSDDDDDSSGSSVSSSRRSWRYSSSCCSGGEGKKQDRFAGGV